MTNDKADRRAWFACYTAALTGVLGARAGAEMPATEAAKLCRAIADEALVEAHRRWANEPLDPFLGDSGGR